jgi:hypothetical protein
MGRGGRCPRRGPSGCQRPTGRAGADRIQGQSSVITATSFVGNGTICRQTEHGPSPASEPKFTGPSLAASSRRRPGLPGRQAASGATRGSTRSRRRLARARGPCQKTSAAPSLSLMDEHGATRRPERYRCDCYGASSVAREPVQRLCGPQHAPRCVSQLTPILLVPFRARAGVSDGGSTMAFP